MCFLHFFPIPGNSAWIHTPRVWKGQLCKGQHKCRGRAACVNTSDGQLSPGALGNPVGGRRDGTRPGTPRGQRHDSPKSPTTQISVCLFVGLFRVHSLSCHYNSPFNSLTVFSAGTRTNHRCGFRRVSVPGWFPGCFHVISSPDAQTSHARTLARTRTNFRLGGLLLKLCH